MAASYFFYGFWDWRFLGLIVFSTLLDYFCGQAIARAREPDRRRGILLLSLAGNLGVLGFFKYFNFFVDTARPLLEALGLASTAFVLDVVLPVGISFYTFQTLSYTIDIYRGELEPTSDLLDFALFVAFFPQLVAGPIERARRLLPQITRPRAFDRQRFEEGCWLIYWGLYKKVFVADNAAKIVDRVYNSPADFSAPDIVVATYAFAVQIYCDFSGYTDMARGLAKTLGFEISLNFDIPYAATDPRDFWRRWHITLSHWLRDYLYIPLGGSRGGGTSVYANLMITMALGGLWHGARWHFVVWGIYHGVLLIAHRFIAARHQAPAETPRPLRKALSMIGMFHLTCLGWILFRAQSLDQAGALIWKSLTDWSLSPGAPTEFGALAAYSALIVLMQVHQYRNGNPSAVLDWPPAARAALYVVMYLSLTLAGAYDGPRFIYFQF